MYGDSHTGNDLMYGGSGNDWMSGGNGGDTLHGDGGKDTLYGGSSSDELYGGDGNDELHGNDGNDTMSGGSGSDWMSGGNGNDDMSGDSGNDTLYGGDGRDTLDGGDDDDQLYGGFGNDLLYGGDGNDMLSGGGGDDLLFGGAGNDVIHGDSHTGNDTIYGGTGDDTIYGGNGADEIYGGNGDDGWNILTGGEGDDTFFFTGYDETANGPDHLDVVVDFDCDDDTVDLSAILATVFGDGPIAFEDLLDNLSFEYGTYDTWGAGTMIWFDFDGAGGEVPDQIAFLDGFGDFYDLTSDEYEELVWQLTGGDDPCIYVGEVLPPVEGNEAPVAVGANVYTNLVNGDSFEIPEAALGFDPDGDSFDVDPTSIASESGGVASVGSLIWDPTDLEAATGFGETWSTYEETAGDADNSEQNDSMGSAEYVDRGLFGSTPGVIPGDIGEPGGASDVSGSDWVSVHISGSLENVTSGFGNDDDYYEIELVAGERLIADVDGASFDIDLFFRDDTNGVLTDVDESSDGADYFSFTVTESGTYYVHIRPDGGNTTSDTDYDLWLSINTSGGEYDVPTYAGESMGSVDLALEDTPSGTGNTAAYSFFGSETQNLITGSEGDDILVNAAGAAAADLSALDWVQWSVEDGGNGNWYKVVNSNGITWTEADTAAQGLLPGSHLATLTTGGENDFVEDLVDDAIGGGSSSSNEDAWIGLFDADPGTDSGDVDWQWVNDDGSVSVADSDWGSGEPDNDSGSSNSDENYAYIRVDDGWRDASGDHEEDYYVAEIDAGDVPEGAVTLNGGAGSDHLVGLDGTKDVFQIGDDQILGADVDTILGFSQDDGDVLDLNDLLNDTAGLDDILLEIDGGSTNVSVGNADTATWTQVAVVVDTVLTAGDIDPTNVDSITIV
jgi:hypothetical protein